MGSFVAVNNFRANLNSSWRHAFYRFSPGVDFRYWAVEKMIARFAGTYMSIRLGMYLSHSTFSAGAQTRITGFFFDSFLDRRYGRLRKLFTRLGRPNKRKFHRRLQSGDRLPLVRERTICNTPVPEIHLDLPHIVPQTNFIHGNTFRHLAVSTSWMTGVGFSPCSQIPCAGSGVWVRSLRLGVLLGLRFFLRLSGSCRRCVVPKPVVGRARLSQALSIDLIPAARPSERFVSGNLRTRERRNPLTRASIPAQLLQNFVRSPSKVRRFARFRRMLNFIHKFFFSYYFRYYPYRFAKIFRTSGFRFTKNVKMSFIRSGWKLRWAYLGRRTISSWLFNQVYSRSVRRKTIFCFTQNFKAVGSRLGVIDHSNSFLVNLSSFGILPSKLISRMFARRLKRRERVNPVLYSLIRLVLTRKKVIGLVILRNGRFTKRQRAIHAFNRIGRVSYNSHIIPIDYAFSTAILKYSMVAIKVRTSAAPATSFHRQGSIADGAGLVYPSSLVGFLTYKYWYIWKVVSFFKYLFPVVSIVAVRSRNTVMSRSKFCFRGSWNSKYMRAYRRFAKSFVFSKYNYVRRLAARRDKLVFYSNNL
jgi:hypothetical protein